MSSHDEIDWRNLDLSTEERVLALASAVERCGKRAVARAIAGHKAAGNPVYFSDPARPSVLVKEMPNGERREVRVSEAGQEIEVGPAPA